MATVYENELIRVETHESEVPWLIVFSQYPYQEFSQAPSEVRLELFRAMDIIEKSMLEYYKPKKINIASFGNYLPDLHWHVMARFENDSFFPEPMWGKQQREGDYRLTKLDEFVERVRIAL